MMFGLLRGMPLLAFLPALWEWKRRNGHAYAISMIGGVTFFINLELGPSYSRMTPVDVAALVCVIAWPIYRSRRQPREELAPGRAGT